MSRAELRFSLYSGMPTRYWFLVYTPFIGLLAPAQLMQSYASCLVSQGVVAACSAAPLALVLLVYSALMCQLVCCSRLLQSLLYKLICTMYVGVACLCCVFEDSVSSFPML